MTPEALKKMRERCEAATEGPWERYNDEVCNIRGKGTSCIASTHRWGAGRYREHLKCHGDLSEQEHQDNCNFVTHARQDLPTCLDEIERLQGIEAALRNLYNDCRNESCDEQRGKAMDEARKALEPK